MALELGMTLDRDTCSVLALLVLSAALAASFWRARQARAAKARAQAAVAPKNGTAKASERPAGEWTPVAFDYPRVEPFQGDLSSVRPIPYRPFRWGEYFVTMGIRGMQWDQWIEPDQQFVEFFRIKQERIKTRGPGVVRTEAARPGVVGAGHEPARELMYELAEYLSRRYPSVYEVVRHSPGEEKARDAYGWYGDGQIKNITIRPVGVTYNLDEEDPMTVIALLVQEDIAILVEGTDGRYYLQAGAICIPGSWRLQDKIGLALDEIHIPAVPQYATKLEMSMTRYFRRLPVDKPVVRNNYAFQIVSSVGATELDPTELAWARTMNGDEDTPKFEWERGLHIRSEAEEKEERKHVVTPETLILRTERQTLRRLPRTGAIVFTIRVYQTLVEELAKEPGVPGRLASAIRSWPEDVAKYKARTSYEDIALYLDQCHAEQVKKGIYKEEHNIPQYPF
ncbi:hypothetical protein CERSUDRAFT_111549 [Gelatoporia subvermispora B]|uniref:DUF3445 domain-containing protein n=1 Tax=Ceriporiopsis subvermispora (strain B) TaxID=914234 RepID=M2RQ40_CERS8|nr:hypothetical protein CERSUDRAFT_111549 [Gelatoporia subvermispora B]